MDDKKYNEISAIKTEITDLEDGFRMFSDKVPKKRFRICYDEASSNSNRMQFVHISDDLVADIKKLMEKRYEYLVKIFEEL